METCTEDSKTNIVFPILREEVSQSNLEQI